jgi:hypothetical protein
MFKFIQVIQRTSLFSMILFDLMIIKLILSQSFCLIAAARIFINFVEYSLSTLIVSLNSIFINLKTLNSRALMKKLFTNNTKSKFEEKFLHSCMIIKKDEMSFHFVKRNLNCFIDFNSLILTI